MTGRDTAGADRIDTSRPRPARMYDWYLGGKDSYPVDEEMGRQMLALDPRVPVMARVDRAFMHRATRWLAGQGVRQFLDIGTGIPTEPHLHQVAQQIAPDARVVHCDNDPVVPAHAAALLRSTETAATEKLKAAGVTLALRSREGFSRFYDGPDWSSRASRSSTGGTRNWASRCPARMPASSPATGRWPASRDTGTPPRTRPEPVIGCPVTGQAATGWGIGQAATGSGDRSGGDRLGESVRR
jgi:hypothetical protein